MAAVCVFTTPIAALFLIKPGWITDLIGLGLLILVAGWQYITTKEK
jgi:UPF0716 family protein affecting phage T7 exclusion